MRRIATTLSLTLLALACNVAQAQSMRPGLWQVEQRMSGNPELEAAMAQARKQMEAMPPEQRKMMEGILAKQGIAMPGSNGDTGMTVKVCMSKEMVERMDIPKQTKGDCTHEITSRSSNALSMRFSCKNPESSGEGHYTFSSDTAYEMRIALSNTHEGKVQNTTINGSGKWLGNDCGTIKPVN
ncbi:MAG TPA: DUF3617 domain-containing protein [Arenimonas sp.]|nr:DUF3617 domain-containing protein [Arenimonas sp.]